MTKIEWTDRTWNPITGCTKVSAGCDHCYADGIATRFAGTAAFPRGFDLTLRPERLDAPLRWRKPSRVFVNSMSDLFHDQVPDSFIASVFAVMVAAPKHTFQVLTKRHGRMRSLLRSDQFLQQVSAELGTLWRIDPPAPLKSIPEWIWIGVSAEDQKWASARLNALADVPARAKFASCEPLLGPVDVTPWLENCLDWVIVGGESGPGARPMHPDWARALRDQCVAAEVPFFFKQWGCWCPPEPEQGHSIVDDVTDDDRVQIVDTHGRRRGRPWPGWRVQDDTRDAAVLRRYSGKTAGRLLDGRTWDEYPHHSRELPC